jgi:hypothetical protein
MSQRRREIADFDATVASALDAVVPAMRDGGEWAEVVRGAAARRRRRRLLVWSCLTAVAVGAIVPLASAAGGWWFFSGQTSPTPPPATSRLMVLKTTLADGQRWALTAYWSRGRGLCLGLTPNPPSGSLSDTESRAPRHPVHALACGLYLHGNVPAFRDGKPRRLAVFVAGGAQGSTMIFGAAAPEVRTVVARYSGGDSAPIATLAAPKELRISGRFFVAFPAVGRTVVSIVGRDAARRPVERLRIESSVAQRRRSNSTVTYSYSWGS